MLAKAIVEGKQPSLNFDDGWRVELIADAVLESGVPGTGRR